MNTDSDVRGGWSVTKRIIVSVAIILIVLVVGFHSGYEMVKPRVQEGVSLSAPARTAFGVLCSENNLRPGLSWDDPILVEFKLAKPDQSQGVYVKSVTLSTQEGDIGTIKIVYKEIRNRFLVFPVTMVDDGATVIYRGVCGPGGSTWSIDPASTVPKKYWPEV